MVKNIKIDVRKYTMKNTLVVNALLYLGCTLNGNEIKEDAEFIYVTEKSIIGFGYSADTFFGDSNYDKANYSAQTVIEWAKEERGKSEYFKPPKKTMLNPNPTQPKMDINLIKVYIGEGRGDLKRQVVQRLIALGAVDEHKLLNYIWKDNCVGYTTGSDSGSSPTTIFRMVDVNTFVNERPLQREVGYKWLLGEPDVGFEDNKQLINNLTTTEENGKAIIVQRKTGYITRGEELKGITISGKKSRIAIRVESLGYTRISGR